MDIAAWIKAQQPVLVDGLTRMRMAELESADIFRPSSTSLSVRIWRNYAAEPMEQALSMVSRYWGIDATVTYSSYDDSLSFGGWTEQSSGTTDVIMVDRSHYTLSDDEFEVWLRGREEHLGLLNGTEPVVVVVGDSIVVRAAGGVVSIVSEAELGGPVGEERYERISGSRLTPASHSAIARELACSWAVEGSVPPRKLVAVDLDNTLHRGVLGEIGMEVVVDEQALALQRELVRAKEAGFMLAILSKNDERDVLKLLDEHPDYLLRAADFVSIEANWSNKPTNMVSILEKTRIGADSIVFVDDNPSELMQMHAVHPTIALVMAGEELRADAALRLVPGFRRARTDELGDLRTRDLVSNEARERLLEQGLTDYYRTAAPRLSVHDGAGEHLERLVDLGKRSNQFNLLLNRSGRDEFTRGDRTAVALEMSDNFSESGVIGGILVESSGDGRCSLVDMFLSCRVLGRNLETALIANGLLNAVERLGGDSIEIPWIIGERNEPALAWIGRSLLGGQPREAGATTVSLERLRQMAGVPEGVSVEVTI